MKLFKDKNDIFKVLTLLIFVILIVLLFFSEELNIPFNYSYKNIIEKKDDFSEKDSTIYTNEEDIESKITRLETLNVTLEDSNKALYIERNRVDNINISYDINSILIFIEAAAKENNIDISVKYDKILKDINLNNIQQNDFIENSEEMNIENVENLENETENEQDSIELTTFENNSENQKDTNTDLDDVETFMSTVSSNKLILSEANMNNALIPIEINGKYSDIKAFIKHIDSFDFANPSYIKLLSEGKKSTGFIILNVLYD